VEPTFSLTWPHGQTLGTRVLVDALHFLLSARGHNRQKGPVGPGGECQELLGWARATAYASLAQAGEPRSPGGQPPKSLGWRLVHPRATSRPPVSYGLQAYMTVNSKIERHLYLLILIYLQEN